MWRVNNAEPVFHYDFGILINPFPIKGPILSTYLQKETLWVMVQLEWSQQ